MKSWVLLLTLFSCAKLPLGTIEPTKRDLNLVWAKNLSPEYRSGNLSISTGGVTQANNLVYAGSLDGTMTCYQAANGKLLWKIKEKFPLSSQALVVDDQVVYGAQSGRLYSRDAYSGKLNYQIDLEFPIESKPVYYQGRLLIYQRGHAISLLDAKTGKLFWTYKRAVPISVTVQKVSKPLFLKNKIILGFADGYAGALSIADGGLLWETRLITKGQFLDIDLDPVLLSGDILIGSPYGDLVRLNAEDGSLKQNYSISASSTPDLKNGVMVFGTPEGAVVFMNELGKVLKKEKVSTSTINHTGWWKDLIVAIDIHGKIYTLDPLSLKQRDLFDLGSTQSAVFADPHISEEGMALFSSRSRLYYFR